MSIIDTLSPNTRGALFCLAIRFAQDVGNNVEIVSALRKSLMKEIFQEDMILLRRRIRGECYAKYMDSEKHFIKIGVLGSGGFGEVSLVMSRHNSSKLYALKKILCPSTRRTSSHCQSLAIEKDAMLALESEHVVALKAAWLEAGFMNRPDAAFLLCEYMPRGDLNSVILQIHPMVATETNFAFASSDHCATPLHEFENDNFERKVALLILQARVLKRNIFRKRQFMNIFLYYTYSIVEMVNFLHNREIVHFDLKPHNILVTADLKLKLADFGLLSPFKRTQMEHQFAWASGIPIKYSTMDIPMQKLHLHYELAKEGEYVKLAGTRIYKPPESLGISAQRWPHVTGFSYPTVLIHRHYKHDWWAVGVILFQLYTGIHPFWFAYSRENPGFDLEIWCKYICNPKIHIWPIYSDPKNVTNPNPFILDDRLLDLVKGLTQPETSDRWTGDDVMSDPDFNCLLQRHETMPKPGWTWNQLRLVPLESRGEQLLRIFHEAGDQQPQQASPPGPGGFSRIPEVQLFATMSESPGVIASPQETPRTRFIRVQGGPHTPPSPPAFDDDDDDQE